MTLLEDIREILKALKHRKPSKIYCPRCTSSKIHHLAGQFLLTPEKFVCDDCGYSGPIVMELEKEEKKTDNI